jgi:Holliday junction resolvasome RuvABC endonuclease subunit
MKRSTTTLAIDPGLRDLGFAVLSGTRLLASGVRPLRLHPRNRRAEEARRLVYGWIRAYRPETLVLEATHGHSVGSFAALNRLALSLRRVAIRHRVTVVTYAPQTVRKSIVGSGWATKKETAVAISCRFPALRVYLTQDKRWKEVHFLNLFDAVALALHHQARSA